MLNQKTEVCTNTVGWNIGFLRNLSSYDGQLYTKEYKESVIEYKKYRTRILRKFSAQV
jgi:hypothetical protein